MNFDKIMGGGMVLVGAVVMAILLSSAIGGVTTYQNLLNVNSEADWNNYKSLDTGLTVDGGILAFNSSGSGSLAYTSEDVSYNENITQIAVDGAVYDSDNSSIEQVDVTIYNSTGSSLNSVTETDLGSGSTVIDLSALANNSNADHFDVKITLQRDSTSITSPEVDAHITKATGGESLIAPYAVPLFLLGTLVAVVYGIYRSFM